MPAYLVTLDASRSGRTLKNGCNAMVVFAADGTAAKEACHAKFDADGSQWNSAEATATEIVAGADFNGWTLAVDIYGPDTNCTVSVVGTSGNNTIDEVAALMVTALNARSDIAGAAYDVETQILTVAAIADGIGDHNIAVRLTPPNGYGSVASLLGTIVDNGVAGAVLTVVLPADDDVIPSVPVPLISA